MRVVLVLLPGVIHRMTIFHRSITLLLQFLPSNFLTLISPFSPPTSPLLPTFVLKNYYLFQHIHNLPYQHPSKTILLPTEFFKINYQIEYG